MMGFRQDEFIFKVGKFQNLRTFQHTPGTYQNDPQPTVYVSEFLNHLGVWGSLARDMLQGYVGAPLDRSILVSPAI